MIKNSKDLLGLEILIIILNFDKPTHELLSDICADLIYIKHNRNGLSPSVGSGYVV
jgi:hypothetical protein